MLNTLLCWCLVGFTVQTSEIKVIFKQMVLTVVHDAIASCLLVEPHLFYEGSLVKMILIPLLFGN